MYIPNDWYNEFKEYSKTEFRNNMGIYDSFTDAQIEVIKEYFRWRSKSRFKELVENTNLQAKPKKAELLSQLMGGATDWVYDGCVDTGYLGGGVCDLGHPLRYEHYAFSPSTGLRLIFGITCASDFFGIEPEKLRKIATVQEEVLEEIKFIAFIINTGKHLEYIRKFYKDLPDIITAFRDRLDEVFGRDWNRIMGAFLKAGLPLTQSMVNRIEYVRCGAYAKYLENVNIGKQIASLCQSKEVEEFVMSGHWRDLYYTKIIMSCVTDNSGKLDGKKKVALLRIGFAYYNVWKDLVASEIDIEKLVESATAGVYKVRTGRGVRLATKSEINDRILELFVDEVPLIDEEKYKMLAIFAWGVQGKYDFYKKSQCETSRDIVETVVKSSKLMVEAIKWLGTSKNELLEMIPEINRKAEEYKQMEYPDEPEDEGTTKSIDEAIHQMYGDERLKKKAATGGIYSIAYDICRRYVEMGETRLSNKQKEVLARVYEDLYNGASDDDDIFEKIEILLKNKDAAVLKKHAFAFKVIETVKKYGRVSDKQRKIIEEAYNALVNSFGIPVFVENDKEKNGKNGRNGDSVNIDAPEENNEGVFVSKENKKGKGRAAFGDMPSISEMSQALGSGLFKYKE